MNKINWGILGLGNISKIFCESFKSINNAQLLAVSSKNESKRNFFKKKFLLEDRFVFKDYEDLINCPKVDIIYVALPNTFHYKWVSRIIYNNKHVLVEKPSTSNYSEAKNISKDLIDKKIFFGEAFMYRFHPQIEFLIDLIKNNEIGNIISINSKFGHNLLTKKKFFIFNKKKKINSESRLFNKNLGGGCILDLGCYPASFSLLIASINNVLDEKKLKIYKKEKILGETNVDIDANIELSFDDRIKSHLFSSFKRNLGYSSEIIGENGKIVVNNTWMNKDNFIYLKKKSHKEYNLSTNINSYTRQIEKISQNLINGKFYMPYPGISTKQSFVNMKILDEWLNE